MARPNVTLESRREEMRKVRKAGEPSDLWHIPMSYLFGSVRSSEGQVRLKFVKKQKNYEAYLLQQKLLKLF